MRSAYLRCGGRLTSILFLCICCIGAGNSGTPSTDVYFGKAIEDPYRWLEDGSSAKVKAWQEGQDARTRSFLDGVAGRDRLRSELDALFEIGSVDQPAVAGPFVFYEYRAPGSQQKVLRAVGARSERTLVDPNAMSSSGGVAMDWWYPSTTGKYVAAGLSTGGSEQSTLHVFRVGDGSETGEAIDRTQSATVAWTSGDEAFYYSRFDPGGTAAQAGRRIYLHQLGKNLTGDGDREIYGARNAAADWPFVVGSPDGRWMLLGEPHGSSVISPITDSLLDTRKPDATPAPLFSKPLGWMSTDFGPGALFTLTDWDAPNRRVFSVDLTNPNPSRWKQIIPESADLLESIAYAGTSLVANYTHDVHSDLRLYSTNGSRQGTVPLPGLGNASCCTYDPRTSSVYFTYVSFNTPTAIYRYSTVTKKTTLWRSVHAAFDDKAISVEQVTFRSKDGTQIPMFIVRRKGARPGPHPLLLMGYGGFGVSLLPSFSVTGIEFVLHGGIYAVPNIRGGGEFGARWHEAGMLLKKQNTFDDFEAAAQWLISNNYTSANQLAIIGASNGGLLTAVAETQRPQLFRAVVS